MIILLDISPENDVFFEKRMVWIITYTLAITPMDKTTREIINHRYRNARCAHCYMPILEHIYDSSNATVLNWPGNCAIVKSKRNGKTG
jgi:hypothetical protein